MKVVRSYPGSLGEVIQGKAYGKELLLSCPVNLFTRVMVFESILPVNKNKYPKCKKFMKNILESWGYIRSYDELDIEIVSEIPIGKGFASSTADIMALYLSLLKLFERKYDEQDLINHTIGIEPTDSIIFPEMTLFDYKNGDFKEILGSYLEFNVLVFEGQKVIDTVGFNKNVKCDLAEIEDLIPNLKQAVSERNIEKLANISSESILRNQYRLKYDILPIIKEIQIKTGGIGIIGAHSGDFLGIIYSENTMMKGVLNYGTSIPGYKKYALKTIANCK
ncbi:GHMP family kinase ATP-binding protein [Clostridium sp.]|jgi:L-threonine kinase|uniref:GHMP family kinase ATP-binding protein n=1 Tax=Clostridium sp. TaxID=1506 RepID=UPI003EED9D5B